MFFSYFLVFFAQNGSEDNCLWILRNSASYFFGFSSVIRCLEQLWLDAPGGLPRLKDNENRAETYVFLMLFSQFYRCSGGSSRSQKTMNTVHKTGAESDRLASTFFCCFWLFFYWFWRVCLKRQWIPCRNFCFFNFFSQFHRCAGRPPEAKRQRKPCRNFTKKRPFWKVKKCVFRDPQPKTNKNKLPEFNPQQYLWSGGGPKPLIFVPPPVPRSNSSLLGISFTVFLFGNYTSGRSPEAKRQ